MGDDQKTMFVAGYFEDAQAVGTKEAQAWIRTDSRPPKLTSDRAVKLCKRFHAWPNQRRYLRGTAGWLPKSSTVPDGPRRRVDRHDSVVGAPRAIGSLICNLDHASF
jgi:hypothetical protein